MMRLLLCMGDQPETGGTIEPYSAPPFHIREHQAAHIGALVHCNACNSSGPIAKAGGPRRHWHHSMEVAHEGDIVLCKCAQPPRMIATTQSTFRNDDMIESMGDVSEHKPESPSESGQRTLPFDQQFTLRDRATQKPLGRVSYVITKPSGETFAGVTDNNGMTQRVKTSAAERLALAIQH